MNKLNKAVIGVETRVRAAKQKVAETVKMKRSGDASIITAVIMIVIAVALLVTFRTAITGWLTTLIGYFEGQLNKFTIT